MRRDHKFSTVNIPHLKRTSASKALCFEKRREREKGKSIISSLGKKKLGEASVRTEVFETKVERLAAECLKIREENKLERKYRKI